MFQRKVTITAVAAFSVQHLLYGGAIRADRRHASTVTKATLKAASMAPTKRRGSKVPDAATQPPPPAAVVAAPRPVPPPVEDDPLSKVVATVCASAGAFADLDDVIAREADRQRQLLRASDPVARTRPVPITFRTFAASLVCAKKFYLLQHRQDLVPAASIGEAVHLDDSASFNELARRWDRLQFGSKAILISDSDHETASTHTEEVITNYFENTYASLGEQAPSLTIHRPAFSAPFGGSARHDVGTAHPMTLRARPAVLRYRPKDNQWVILESQAVVDPLGNAARAGQSLQRIHFSMLAFRYWITQPHIPIAVRKRFLKIDLGGVTAAMQGHVLAESAHVAAPIDLKRSGILHIRQFFPGPATLLDCDPPRLVKFIQRLSLEDLLEVNRNHQLKSSHAGGAFDLSSLGRIPDAIATLQRDIADAQKQAARHANPRSTRGLKLKDSDEHLLFEHQQLLMEALLQHHTLKLVEAASNPQQVSRWESFSAETPDGLVADGGQAPDAAAAELAAGKKKAAAARRRGPCKGSCGVESASAVGTPCLPSVPCFSENLGAHCSRDGCPFFVEGRCLPQKVNDAVASKNNHLFAMPSTSVGKKVTWWLEGMRTVRDVLHQNKKGAMKLTAPQIRYAEAVTRGCLAIHPTEIENFFAKVRYPLFIIDFEATQFALPPYQKVVAYQSVPYQFSMDVFHHDVLTETPKHYDFLHFGKGYSPNVDPRKACIDELMRIVHAEREKKRAEMAASGELQRRQQDEEASLADMQAASGQGKRGRRSTPKKVAPKVTRASPLQQPVNPYDGCFIAHFASFEKSCLEKLGQLEERHKEDIKHFYFLDTMDLVKKGFVHPNAHGSNSLKKILPAVCPDFQYGVFGTDAETDADAEEVSSDEQKGENALGIYRLWYHQEGGGTIEDLQRSATTTTVRPASSSAADVGTRVGLPLEVREKVWFTLRIQLLEYCSLDTKALYEIMREIWKEKEVAKKLPAADKSGWVFVKPTPREVNL